MKRLFWLLVILNLGLLTYFNLGLFMPSDPEIKLAELHPEKIKILNANQIEVLPRKMAPTPEPTMVPAQICFEWGRFSDAELPRAQNALITLGLQAQVKNLAANPPKRYWVYRTPLSSNTEAQKKVNELKALGINDLFVVQENKWKYAISFGIFEDEQLAEKLMQELQAKGIKNIKKTARNSEKNQYSLVFGTLSEDHLAQINRLQPDFPATKVAQGSCEQN